MANIILGRNDSQNLHKKVELFLIWCTLMGTHANTGAFVIHHLVEVGKTTHENAIGMGGTLIVITQALGHEEKLGTLELTF